jgi:hypothetical protein
MPPEEPDKVLAAEEDDTALAMHAEHLLDELADEGGGGGVGDSGGPTSSGSEAVVEATSGDGVPVVDSTGTVVDTAHVNPETGMFETDTPETTVIEESSGSPTTPGGGGDLGTPTETPAAPGDQAQPDMGAMPHGAVPPEAFHFTPDTQNSQRSQCVAIVFAAATPFGPARIIVGVQVTAPLRLRDGRPLTPREAQIDSSSAATATAEALADLLTEGILIPTQVRALFWQRMNEIMMAQGIGYRVQNCTPSG